MIAYAGVPGAIALSAYVIFGVTDSNGVKYYSERLYFDSRRENWQGQTQYNYP